MQEQQHIKVVVIHVDDPHGPEDVARAFDIILGAAGRSARRPAEQRPLNDEGGAPRRERSQTGGTTRA